MIPTETRSRNGLTLVRDALLWAILAAILVELVVNLTMERSLWHRVTNIEQKLDQVQHELTPQVKP